MLKIEGSKIIQLAVGMAVGIILIVGLIWPVVDDSTDDIYSAYNNEVVRYSSALGAGEQITAEISGGVLYVNGDTIDYYTDEQGVTIISDKFLVSYTSGNVMTLAYDGMSGRQLNITSITVDSTGFTYVGSDNASHTITTPIERLIYPDNDGDIGAYKQGTFNVTAGDTAYYSIISSTEDNGYMAFYGEVVNGVESFSVAYVFDSTNNVRVDASSFEFEPREVTFHEKEGYYTLSSAFNYSINEYESYYGGAMAFAPVEYHVITEMDGNIRTMIGVAGMLIVVLMVVMVARNLMD